MCFSAKRLSGTQILWRSIKLQLAMVLLLDDDNRHCSILSREKEKAEDCSMIASSAFIHPTAEVSILASIGAYTRIWGGVQVREGALIGDNTTLGKGVYIDTNVQIGSNGKIQNHVSVFEGVTLEDGVFVGPHVCFTNDRYPRAITRDGRLKDAADWTITPTLVRYGASLGAGAIIRCGITIGTFALVGAGAVVTRDVSPHALVLGNPARQRGYVCYCARLLTTARAEADRLLGICPVCGVLEISTCAEKAE
jgi:UDP-2-acetamido-3-amino-2,3-dideoxy-glucuronate N-acetyltransferase